MIRERTQAGLSAARARGRVGGRPKGLSPQAEATAMAAETLYRERRLSVSAIAKKLHVSKSTMYAYLRHRGVEVGPYEKSAQLRQDGRHSANGAATDAAGVVKTATVLLWLRVENNNKFVRGKKRARENIERYHLQEYGAKRLSVWHYLKSLSGEYELKAPYRTDEDLDKTMNDLLREIAREADLRNCFSETEARLEGTERYW